MIPTLVLIYFLIYSIQKSLNWQLVHDASIMHYIAFLLDQGQTPYTDFFDFNLPGTYFVHFLLYNIFGSSDVGFRVADIILGLCITYNTYSFLSSVLPKKSIIWNSISFFIFLLLTGPQNVLQRETLLILILSFFLKQNYTSKNQNYILSFLIGIGVLIKPSIVILALLYFIYLIINKINTAQIIKYIVTMGIFPLLTLLYLFSTSAFSGFLEMLAYTSKVYVQIFGLNSSLSNLVIFLTQSKYSAFYFSLSAISLISIFQYFNQTERTLSKNTFFKMTSLIIFGFAHVVIQKRGSAYHFFPLAYSLLVIFPIFLYTASRNKNQISAVACCIYLFFIWSNKDSLTKSLKQNTYQERHIQKIFDEQSINKNHKVAILETAQGIITTLLRNEIELKSKYFYDLMLFHKTNSTIVKKHQQSFVNKLSNVDFIIVARRTWGHKEAHPLYGFKKIESIPGSREILQNQFSIVHEDNRIRIYKKLLK